MSPVTREPLHFPAGSTLTIHRAGGVAYNRAGDRMETTDTHTIGPCSVVMSKGNVDWSDGVGEWVGTVTVECPPGSDIKVTDRVECPNGEFGVVAAPANTPVNPFTGWSPFTQFTMSTPGYTPEVEA